jgi:hypothetical protein
MLILILRLRLIYEAVRTVEAVIGELGKRGLLADPKPDPEPELEPKRERVKDSEPAPGTLYHGVPKEERDRFRAWLES